MFNWKYIEVIGAPMVFASKNQAIKQQQQKKHA